MAEVLLSVAFAAALTAMVVRVLTGSKDKGNLLQLPNVSDSHSNLFSLLVWGLFSPLHSDSDSEFNQVFNSLMPAIKKGSIEPIDCELSGVLRFSFLQSLLTMEGVRTTQPSEPNQLLNSLVSATHSSFLSNSIKFGLGKDEISCSEILPQAQQKAYLLLGPAGTHRFLHHWASKFTAESFNFYLEETPYPDMLGISYSSSFGRFWKITSYSPLLSMETCSGSPITEGPLHEALNYHLLHCIFQFRNVVKFCPDWIEVCLEIDNVRCDVTPLEPLIYNIKADFPNKLHFPARICLTIGPENGCVIQSVSLPLSSRNPITDIGKGNTYEASFKPPRSVGLKASVATTYTDKIKNWGFEQSVVEESDAKIDWTVYDSTTGKAIFNNGPPKFSAFGPKTWSTDRYSKASRAFTEKGGVVFAKDEYGAPIIWRLNRDLEGQTLKWIVKGSVWLTYWPNTHRTRYSETKRHDFCQELDLTLTESSGSAPS